MIIDNVTLGFYVGAIATCLFILYVYFFVLKKGKKHKIKK